jgi:hypothetical protein
MNDSEADQNTNQLEEDLDGRDPQTSMDTNIAELSSSAKNDNVLRGQSEHKSPPSTCRCAYSNSSSNG